MGGVRVYLLLLLDNGAEKLGTRGVVPKDFFDSLPKLKSDGHGHTLSYPIKIVAVKVVYRDKISFSSPNTHSFKGRTHFETFLSSTANHSSRS